MPSESTGSGRVGRSRRVGRVVENYPWLVSAGIGVATFVVEYVVVALSFLVGPASVDVEDPVDAGITFAHVLYNAHNVPTRQTAVDGTATNEINALYAANDPAIPVAVFFLVPAVALFVAGVVVGRRRYLAPDYSIPKVSADNAGELALGYGLAGLVGAFVFVRTGNYVDPSLTVRAAPSLPLAAAAFLLYPIVFGWLGSVAAFRWRRRES